MSEEYSIGAIAHIRTDFPTKFGIPRQSGIVDGLRARIVFEPGFANPDAVRGIEQFSHLWLIWRISAVPDGKHSLTVRPPRLGGNKKLGVFATRSPFRPNSLGLSSVKLERVEYSDTLGPVLTVSGADLMDMTPIIDIKPYLPYTDSHPEALCGFADEVRSYSLEVEFPDSLLERLPEDKRGGAPGMVGLETAFSVCYTKLCREYGMPLADLSRLMSRGPAEILGLNKGLIAEGYDGDVVLVELGEPYTVRREDFAGKSKNTPYDGLSLYGRVACTVKAGRVTYGTMEAIG